MGTSTVDAFGSCRCACFVSVAVGGTLRTDESGGGAGGSDVGELVALEALLNLKCAFFREGVRRKDHRESSDAILKETVCLSCCGEAKFIGWVF